MAGGALGWQEQHFWQSSLPWFVAAADGWLQANGANNDAMDREDYENFKAEYAAELAMSDDDLRRKREQQQTRKNQ